MSKSPGLNLAEVIGGGRKASNACFCTALETPGCVTSIVRAQNKEGILPVATLSIALYVLRRFMSARGGKFVIGFININKYTSASVRTVNWVTLVSLLVEYLLYSVVRDFLLPNGENTGIGFTSD